MRYDSEMGEGQSDRNRALIVSRNKTTAAVLWIQSVFVEAGAKPTVQSPVNDSFFAVSSVAFAQINSVNTIIRDDVSITSAHLSRLTLASGMLTDRNGLAACRYLSLEISG